MSNKKLSNDPLEQLQIFPKARIYKTKLTTKFKERKVWKRPDRGEIHSTIPGTITSIDVKVGDRVTQSTPLLSYEAMKMQNVLLAPLDGEVISIEVEVGESCKKGTLLLYLNPLNGEEQFEEDPLSATDLGLIV